MAEATTQTAPVDTGRLRYADPRNLPSFPSVGLRSDGAAAGAAATLGWNNPKTIEPWKPDDLSSASAAAVLAKDYKMAPLWEPSANPIGHQAALLAVGSASSALKHQSSSVPRSQHEGWGNSAAIQAFQASRFSSMQANDPSQESSAATQDSNINRSQSARKVRISSPPLSGDRSLAAAKGAMASSRPRATSTPLSGHPAESQLQSKAASNALEGATTAHRASMQPKIPIEEAGAVPITTMTRNMFTSHPMVKPEVDEQQSNERLHQSAVQMAKKMYNLQQKMMDQAKEQGGDPDKVYSSPYLNLQDAAYKQAQERLAKLQNEHLKTREMQEYYVQTPPSRRRFSAASRLRRRGSDDDVFNDREESERIRYQMSIFSTRLSAVDRTKRQHDRDALLAIAQRNVKSQLHGMDEKVYLDTGKVNPSLISDWEARAQQTAQTRHETRDEHKAKLDLGGGMFMDQEKVDAIAAKRMQPILDDIYEKAEKERERVAAQKMEEEDEKADLEREKQHERELKAIRKRVMEEDKEDERERRQQGKEEGKARKEEEKARKQREKAEKAEQKRLAKEKRKSKRDSETSGVGAEDVHEHDRTHDAADADEWHPAIASGAGPVAEEHAPAEAEEDRVPEGDRTAEGYQAAEDDGTAEEEQAVEESPSHRHRMKGWVKNRFSRAKSVGENDDQTPEKTGKSEKHKGLFGGGGLLKKHTQRNASQTSMEHQSSSMRDVALAGKDGEQDGEQHTRDEAGAAGPSSGRDSRGVSPVSSADDDAGSRSRKAQPAVSGLQPPRPLEDSGPRPSASPSRDSRFREEIEI